MDQIDRKVKCIVTDSRALRICILFQLLQEIPVLDAYEAMCKAFGEQFMEYLHFEYWYMGLSNGSLNLDSYDRFYSSERKEWKSVTNYLQTMILDKLNPIDRFTAGAVCCSFKSIIDYQRSNLKKFHIFQEENNVSLYMNDNLVTYELDDDDCLVTYEERELLVKNKRPLEVAMNDASRLLKCRGLNLDYFYVNGVKDEGLILFDALKNVLQSVGVLTTKSVLINWLPSVQIAEILEHFNTEILEDLTIKSSESDENSIKRLVRLEQWKQAKTLTLSPVPHYSLIVKHLAHFQSLNFDFSEEAFSENDITRLRDEVVLESTKFEYFTCERVQFDATHLLRVFDSHSALNSLSGSIVYKSRNVTFDIAYQPDGFSIKKRID
ncbi:F-box domain-containing protein [Caenorhabditis elegans]|uniref:F-box domain-containing protein n=1 Tax=Caenorhabditis elegans TaxID=6239 RepID=O17577_CAEEL|nr:F-box domain-containing protein [Caenorhabditis elegans]CAB07161.2 F-box domain-containing protein [Caenorhabditis elegans]|eukprot:NP_741646.1 F-box A protein [Caenorhabditis elegans]